MFKKIALMSILGVCLTTWGAGQKAPSKTEDPMAQVNAEGSIQGVVKSQSGAPLENAVVVITSTTARGPIKDIAPISNHRGEVSLTDLPPGEYMLQATIPGYAPQKKKVNVEGKKTSSVEFTMTK